MATQVDPPELVAADRASVWIKWYFTRGALTILTLPLVLLLVSATGIAIFGAVVQAYALFRVSWAVFGLLGTALIVAGGWIPLIIPPALYYSLLKNLPGLWIRRDASVRAKILWSAVLVVAMPLCAHLIYQAIALGIGWIADQDPCAAFEAGVTGSIPPTNCD